MKRNIAPIRLKHIVLAAALAQGATSANAADQELLDILLQNRAITQEQYEGLIEQESISSDDILRSPVIEESVIEEIVAAEVAEQIENEFPVTASRSSSGFRFETRDGNWQTNLQWRAQMRFTTPYRSDPRQLSSFNAEDQSNFEARRLRMKIGGHGLKPWIKYYFEIDLQPSRDVDDSSSSSSARVIDWRIDVAKWDWGGIRLGQWKVDLNRERGDSSGRQQFVERSIANRVFTLDRQVGVQFRGHLFEGTQADMRYYAGVFNGEGRSVNNTDNDLLYMARLQWNFMGRDLSWRQTDVEYTELPTGSFAIAGFTNKGSCTRWSSSGCGNLDGFDAPALATLGQFEIDQVVQEFAFKYRGFSVQQEFHRKVIKDSSDGSRHELTGGYAQAGYFFHNLFPVVPAPLELALRYAYVDEPNAANRAFENERREFTVGANWFFNGHDSKVTFDFSRLSIDDAFLGMDGSDNRMRVQWDVQF
ncbi:MAG: porin [SAR86 cluster bacterium]|uniref:Porin n=1 Tax=SAR86 cluster bacterium TaxID=2030880 RepID=A0A2A5CE81_9GAMM|nr:porin [Gammaproteobacteria bacterium AH-315-E17]PCJ41770.1 MAG: porin [SAR86 cluster bacterium]